MLSLFKPSTVAVLQKMAETDDSPWDTQERCAFAKALQSMMKHRAIELRMAGTDGHCSPLDSARHVIKRVLNPQLLS